MSEDRGMGDRRIFTRYPLIINGTASMVRPLREGEWMVATSDISMGGIRLHFPGDLGSLIENGNILRLTFGDSQTDKTVVLHTRVVWKRRAIWESMLVPPEQANLLGQWSVGVEFEETPESEIRRLFEPAARVWGG